MLAKARHLHDLAMTAEAESLPAMGLGDALQQAERDIADMGRLIKVLLAQIDVLQDEAAKQSAPAGGTDLSGGPVEAIAAQLEELRHHVAEAQRVRDATLKAYGTAQSEVPVEQAGEDAASEAQSGTELRGSLARLHNTAARRQQDALHLWTADGDVPEAGAGRSSDGDVVGEDLTHGSAGHALEGPHARAEPSVPPGEGSTVGTTEAESPAAAARPGQEAVSPPLPFEEGGTQASPAAKTDPDDSVREQGSGSAAEPDGGEGPLPGVEKDSDGSAPEPGRRGVLRLPAGAALLLLVATSVVGGMLITRYQAPPADGRGPETRLDSPTTPAGPTVPRSGSPTSRAWNPPSPPHPRRPHRTPRTGTRSQR
ncbi:hypothetical protein WKI68_37540 [Streptomyces sp. MS1.HAVA.3]|uniref:Uncharacterized protein n=1 Tax=Streptomyces caledonius TaxID=3134107 RepID=A0ABU8UD25_9ACTN